MSEEQVEAIFQHACEGAAESIGSTRVDWQRVVDAIRYLRSLLASSEAALQEAQRALFRWLPNRIGSEYDDLIAADAMALMGLESTEGLREVGNEILVELMEKRRLLDAARAQKPVGEYRVDGEWVALYAAPVPAQPAAVPEAVAKDAARFKELTDNMDFAVMLMTDIHGEFKPSSRGWREIQGDELLNKLDAAILSAADDEVKNGH